MRNMFLCLACMMATWTISAAGPFDGGICPDENGVHINAHGGGVLWHGNRYYWYGEHKVAGDAGNVAHGTAVHCYSSADLVNWRDEGAVLTTVRSEGHDLEDGCVIERPKVAYCAKTGKFVMYFHLEIKTDTSDLGYRYASARVGIASNDRPTGEFFYHGSRRPNVGAWPQGFKPDSFDGESLDSARAIANWRYGGENETVRKCPCVFAGTIEWGQTSRDQTLFVDDDGSAYHIYTSEHNSTLHISELSADFLRETGRYWRLADKDWTEAPAVCKQCGWYYILGSGCTGWAPNAARYYRSRSIAGPWERMGNPCKGIDRETGMGAELTFGGQSTCIFRLQDGTGGLIAMFDRWRPENAQDGRYFWRSVSFTTDGRMEICW